MMTKKPFKWTAKRSQAAQELALGYIQEVVADKVGVHRSSLTRWLRDPEFRAEVDRLSLMTGIASRAERLRLAQRAARQAVSEEGIIDTNQDILAWLKFAQGETDGIKLDLTALIDDAAFVAGGGQSGTDREDSTEGFEKMANGSK